MTVLDYPEKKRAIKKVGIIGASPAMVLEACALSKMGIEAKIFTDRNEVGGSWEPKSLLGLSKIENAIHYLLPHENGISAMNRMGISTFKSSNFKRQVYNILGFDLKLPFDGFLACVFRHFVDYQNLRSGCFLQRQSQ